MTLGVGCKDNKSSYVMVVEDIDDREVIILKIFPSKFSNRWAPGHCPRKCETVFSSW